MGRTIVIANQKGGVGKTTTAINLSASLADLGKKILVIDTDPQGNTSSGLGVEKNEVENTVYEGVVFTMYDARTNLSLQVVENVKANLDQKIYKTIIPRNVRLAEAPSYGIPITKYDARSTGAESYRLLAEEVINRGNEEEW